MAQEEVKKYMKLVKEFWRWKTTQKKNASEYSFANVSL